jgi:NAD(P)-dependent dehydrogenase (short-subunit alcohol dehydrogenase family)
VRAVVLGASGGIGAALADRLAARGEVLRLSRGDGDFDLTDEASIAASAARVGGDVDLVFCATGELVAPERANRQVAADALARSFAVNATGPALVAKHFLPLLAKDRRAGFAALSARVGSIGDNRLGGWHAYRAAKAALNQLVRTMAVELTRSHPQAFAVTLHPGTVDTPLSAPFQRGVAPDKLFTTDFAAGRLLSVLDGLDASASGGFFAWDGQAIPF